MIFVRCNVVVSSDMIVHLIEETRKWQTSDTCDSFRLQFLFHTNEVGAVWPTIVRSATARRCFMVNTIPHHTIIQSYDKSFHEGIIDYYS